MQINKKIKEVYEDLPRGSKKMISDISGLSEKTIYNCVNDRSCNFSTISKINKAIGRVYRMNKKVENL